MATSKKKFLFFSQVVFTKTWEGVPTNGIIVRQEFFAIPDFEVGEKVSMRSEDRIGAPVEWTDKAGDWHRLGRGRAI